MTDDISNTKKNRVNAYQREYYKTHVDQVKRKQQFRNYYIKNNERLSEERKLKRIAKKQDTADVAVVEVVSL